MKNRTYVPRLSEKPGYPLSEPVEGLRLVKAFIQLSAPQRSEVLGLVERLATAPAPVPGGADSRPDTR